MTIRTAGSGELLDAARSLFEEYGALPHTAGRWDGRRAEIDGLPGPYAPPGGTLMVATAGGTPVACVAVRALEPGGACELKRLYVRDRARGRGVGRALVQAVVDFARGAGYAAIRLDTAPELEAANALYASFGFRPIDPYREDLYDDALCFELDLSGTARP